MTRRDLVIAAAWPPERQPDRLVESLVDAGVTVTVAVERGRSERFAGTGAEVVLLARANEVNPAALRQLASAAARAAASPADLVRVSRRLGSPASGARGTGARGTGRAVAEGWYRLLPLVGRRWDRVLLPAEEGAVAYLPLVGVAGPGVVVVERLPPATAASRPARPHDARLVASWRSLLGAAGEVLAASPALADAAVALGADAGTTRVVRPGVDPARFRPSQRLPAPSLPAPSLPAPSLPAPSLPAPSLPAPSLPAPSLPAPSLQLACPAPFHWTGGHDYVLVALRRLLDGGHDMHLHLVGDGSGSDRQRLLYTVDDMGLGHAVTVHPRADRLARLALLDQADVAVVAAVADRPWPEILEAMAAGLAVVAGDLPSVREMVAGDVEGLLVPVRDVDALASALARMADPAIRITMGQAGRARALIWAEAHGPAQMASSGGPS